MVVEKISGSAEHKSSHIKYIANSNISPALLPAPNIAQWLSEKKVEQSAEKSLDHILQLSVNIVTLQQSRFMGYHSLLIPVLFISSLVEHIYKYTFLDNKEENKQINNGPILIIVKVITAFPSQILILMIGT